jgi:Leucine-rich repeat (LRR) protein
MPSSAISNTENSFNRLSLQTFPLVNEDHFTTQEPFAEKIFKDLKNRFSSKSVLRTVIKKIENSKVNDSYNNKIKNLSQFLRQYGIQNLLNFSEIDRLENQFNKNLEMIFNRIATSNTLHESIKKYSEVNLKAHDIRKKLKEPEYLETLRSITSLNLSGLELTVLPPEIEYFSGLTHLYLSNNQLSSIPNIIWKLSCLEIFDLSSNQLKSLPDEIGLLCKLKYLILNNNRLEFIPFIPNLGTLIFEWTSRNQNVIDSTSKILNSLVQQPERSPIIKKDVRVINLTGNCFTSEWINNYLKKYHLYQSDSQ